MDSGELLRLFGQEEFAEVKSTSDGERLMIGSVAQRTHLEEEGALGSLQAESPVLIAGRPTTRLLSAGWRRRTLAKSTGVRSVVFFKVPCTATVVCARRLPEDSAKATKSK